MNECEKYMDAISAYIDGELDEIEKAELKAHLEACGNCRSYLEAIKAISDVDAEEEPVPDMLRIKVMDRIHKQKKQRDMGKIMRYLGLCACIAIVVFVAPRLPHLGCGASKDAVAPETMECVADEAAPTEGMNSAGRAEYKAEKDCASAPGAAPSAPEAPAEKCAPPEDDWEEYSYVTDEMDEFSAVFRVPQSEKPQLDGFETRLLDGQDVYLVETETAFEMFDSEYAVVFDMSREYAAVMVEE